MLGKDAQTPLSVASLVRRSRAGRAQPPSPVIRQARAWMVEQALPFWSRKGWDARQGGFHERMSLAGEPDHAAARRMRVQWRQIYVLAHASMLGWTDGLKLAFKGLEHALEHGWAPDGRPGFVQALSADGTVLDPRRDSYDHAFALLALSWLARASGDAQVRALVDRVFHFVCDDLTDAGGFLLESLPPALPRRQNPHMHMFEASLAMVETLGHAEAARLGDRYRRMLDKIFIDRPSGMLIEFFGDDWKPVIEDGASLVEPGHMAEWAWLIRRHEQQKAMKPGPLATHLLGSALRAAEPLHGFLIDEIDTSGRARKTSRRLWPQTELIKAWVAQAETGVERAGEAAEIVMAALLKTYLSGPFPGGWIDQFDAADQPMVSNVPASSLYHIFLAVAEADRLFG